MKKILFIVCVLMASVAFGQGVRLRTNLVGFAAAEFAYIPGYTKLNVRYEFVAMAIDSGFHVPQYNGVPSGVRSGVWQADGAIAADTLNGYFYQYWNGAWVKYAKYSDLTGAQTWQQTLTTGSTLTGNNTIAGGGFNLTWNNMGDITFNGASGKDFNVNAADVYLYSEDAFGYSYIDVLPTEIEITAGSPGKESQLFIGDDSIRIKPHLGQANIDSLRSASDTTLSKPMTWDPATGRWQYLAYWPGGGGITGVTTFGSTPNANGLSVSGANILMQPADATNPGGVSTTTQTFAGNKTIKGSSNSTGQALTVQNSDGSGLVNINNNISNGIVGIGSSPVAGFYLYNIGSFRNDGTIDVGIASGTTGTINMNGSTSGTVTIKTAAAAGTYTLTLPTNDGDASQFLQTNGSGVLSWATPTGTLPSIGNQGEVLQVSNGAAAWKYDTTTLVTFTAGANFAADTAAFTDSTIYGSFKLMGNDTFYVTGVSAVMYSNNGVTDTLGIQITYNDTINVIGSHVFAATYAINNETTGQDADGDDFTGSTSVPIPPGNWVWLKSPTVVAGRKPYHLSVSIIGYKKRVN